MPITDPAAAVRALQEEIRRTRQSRYDQRLHAALLAAQGMTCPEVARLLGVAPRSVEYWVRHFEERGLAGLAERERCGRRRRLSEKQLQETKAVMRRESSVADPNHTPWNGKSLKIWLELRYGVQLGERQCQRMLRLFGFRWRKPYPLTVPAGSAGQKTRKKLQA